MKQQWEMQEKNSSPVTGSGNTEVPKPPPRPQRSFYCKNNEQTEGRDRLLKAMQLTR